MRTLPYLIEQALKFINFLCQSHIKQFHHSLNHHDDDQNGEKVNRNQLGCYPISEISPQYFTYILICFYNHYQQIFYNIAYSKWNIDKNNPYFYIYSIFLTMRFELIYCKFTQQYQKYPKITAACLSNKLTHRCIKITRNNNINHNWIKLIKIATSMKQYQFKTIPNVMNSHQIKKEAGQPNLFYSSRVENKQGNNLTADLIAQNANIQEMKNKLNQLLRQTELLSERKNVSSGKNQKSISMVTGRGSLNSSLSTQEKGHNEQLKFGQKLKTSSREGYGIDYKKQEIKDAQNNKSISVGTGQINLSTGPSRLLSPSQGAYHSSQRNGTNNFNNNNFTSVTFNGQAHKFTHQNNFHSSYFNHNSQARKPQTYRQIEMNTRISEQKIPISQPSQPTKSYISQQIQSAHPNSINSLQFSPNTTKQKTNLNQNAQSPRKSIAVQSQPSRPPSTSRYQVNPIPTTSSPFKFSSDFALSTSTSIPEKKQESKSLQIPTNLSQCQYKLRALDQQYRKLKQQVAELADAKQYYRKELSQQWRNNKKLKQEQELKIVQIKKQHSEEIQIYVQKNFKTIEEYEQKIKEIGRQHAKELQKVQEIVRKKQKYISQLINQLAQAKIKPVYQCYQEKANKIISENKQLIDSLTQKESELSLLKTEVLEKTLKLEQLSERVFVLEKEVGELGNFKDSQIGTQGQNFDSILMLQLKSIAEFKDIIERLNEKNSQLNQKLFESNRKNERYQNQQKISELKSRTTINNLNIESSIQQSNKQNQISTLEKKLLTLQQKYKLSLSQIKSKDQFFKQHLVGRTDMIDVKEYIENVLGKYRQYFSESREEQLKEELEKAMKKIELYQKYK